MLTKRTHLFSDMPEIVWPEPSQSSAAPHLPESISVISPPAGADISPLAGGNDYWEAAVVISPQLADAVSLPAPASKLFLNTADVVETLPTAEDRDDFAALSTKFNVNIECARRAAGFPR